MKPSSELHAVAARVGSALRNRGIRAVLTGGACASIHSAGAYSSLDLDFVVTDSTTVTALDAAMQTVGYRRDGDHYTNPRTEFFVEFPPGPLSIGDDSDLRPVLRARGAARFWTLSATDSCRDRLAAFYHWKDRQSLAVALQIALANRVNMKRIEKWSLAEGAEQGFREFRQELASARREVRSAASAARQRKKTAAGRAPGARTK